MGDKMRFCKNCGNQMEDNSRFCPKCGTATGEPMALQPESVTPVGKEAVYPKQTSKKTVGIVLGVVAILLCIVGGIFVGSGGGDVSTTGAKSVETEETQ